MSNPSRGGFETRPFLIRARRKWYLPNHPAYYAQICTQGIPIRYPCTFHKRFARVLTPRRIAHLSAGSPTSVMPMVFRTRTALASHARIQLGPIPCTRSPYPPATNNTRAATFNATALTKAIRPRFCNRTTSGFSLLKGFGWVDRAGVRGNRKALILAAVAVTLWQPSGYAAIAPTPLALPRNPRRRRIPCGM